MKKQISTIDGLQDISDIYWLTEDGKIWSDYKKDYLKLYKQYNSKELEKKWLDKELDKEPYHLFIAKLRTKDGKIKSIGIHRLIALAFIPNPNNYTEVNHIDKNTSNNTINNLEWCEKDYNIKYSLCKKVWQCDKKTHNKIQLFNSFAEAGKFINGSHSNIINVCKGKRKSAYGYYWEYADD